MTLRELLKSLHAVDEKHLDVDVLVSPASGGYRGISHVSVLYVGHAVIHFEEPKPQEPPDLWAGSGEGDTFATVSPDDLRKVWQLFRDVQARTGGEHCGTASIDIRSFQRVCSPGANAMAVWYRASMLAVMQKFPESPLTPWTHNGDLDDAVFQVAATFPMKKMAVGVEQEGLPLDVEEFVKRIGART
jgi:hypothetical protein